jgi:hypothetical protein
LPPWGQVVIGGLIGPYVVGHERGSFEEIVDVAKTVAIVGLDCSSGLSS